MIALYHYPHCPFCQRIRLFLGYKNIEYRSVVLPYSDKKTPQELCNSSTLPIMDFGDGLIINESLNIIREIENRFPHPIGFIGPVESVFQWSSMVMVSIPRYFDMLLPAYHKHSPEFTENPADAEFFKTTKEQKRGKTFEVLRKESPEIFEHNVLPVLQDIIEKVEEEFFLMGPTFTVADCVLASDLSGLRLVDEISLPHEIQWYIQRVEQKCQTVLV